MSEQVSVRIDDEAAGRIPRAHVTARMKQLLRRLPVRPMAVRVRFSDVNGPKGGADIRCGIVLTTPGEPAIRVERTQTTARLAFDESYERVLRRAGRPRRQWREAQRRPKKYFAARRLWT
jgi:hypothetical protein